MKNYKILIIGCGQLGTRHLQAIATLQDVSEICIVDPIEAALDLGKKRVKEVESLNSNIKFHWQNEFDKKSANGDLCIVATRASSRCELVKEAAKRLDYKKFLIEKIVTQSVSDYIDLLEFVKKHDLSVWVNCQLRTFEIYKYIKNRLNPYESIVFSRIGGDKGLANNGVHSADLFLYLDGSDDIVFSGDRIDPEVRGPEQGARENDLSGSLFGSTKKGSDFFLSFAGNSQSPAHITILGSHNKFIVNHAQNWAFESHFDSKWALNPIPMTENIFVSHTTKRFASDILLNGQCELPTLSESFPSHRFILESLLPHFSQRLGRQMDRCPVT